ncbi:MAG: TonB-dependent receptor [Fusobacterium necrophorum]|nr:TonB-dependent receptor [Fusobacterium necrophorum]
MKKYFVAVSISLALSYQIFAEENPVIKLNETVITSESFGTNILRTPKNITVITARNIKIQGAKNIEDALRGVAGLTAYNNMGGSDPKISLRGMAPGKEEQSILFLLDGIPYNSTVDTGAVNLNLIPIDIVERIEIIPNGGNVVYGEGAVGGVINIITKKGKNKKYYGSFSIDGGSYDLKEYKVNLGSNLTEQLSLDLKYNNRRQKNYRDHHTRDIEYINLGMEYKENEHSIYFDFQNSETEYRFPGYLTKKQIEEGKIKKSTGNIKGKEKLRIYRAKYEVKWAKNLFFNIAGDFKDKLYKSIDEKTNTVSTIRDTESFYISPQIKYQYMPNSYFILGGDFLKGKSKYRYKKDIKTETSRKSVGVFLTNNIKWENFIFTQGYRHQKIKYDVKDKLYPSPNHKQKILLDKTFQQDAYELTANYLLSDTGSIYASYTKAFRAPTADEAGRWRKGYDVKIQEADTFEVGGKFAWEDWYISGSIFHTRTENEILYIAYEDGKLGKNYNLPGKNIRQGIELSLEQYLEKLTLRESFHYLKHKIKKGTFAGNKIPGVPQYIYSLGMDYRILDHVIWSNSFHYYGSAYGNYDYHNKFGKQKGHTELNTSLRYEMKNGLSFYGGIHNLLDKEYFTPKLNAAGTGMNYYYGSRRNYYIGFQYTF